MRRWPLFLLIGVLGCGLSSCAQKCCELPGPDGAAQPEEATVPVLEEAIPAPQEAVTVLVARQRIAMGTRFQKEPERFFEEKTFRKGEEPKAALTRYDQVQGKKLKKPLPAKQIVTADDLMDGTEMTAMLPLGSRAVAIRINSDERGVSSVLPGARVDAIVTIRRDDTDSWSRIILQNMLVLAVDDNERNRTEGKVVPTIVTLAATPEEAETLMLAQAMGAVRLVLCAAEKMETVPPPRPQSGDLPRLPDGGGL